MAFYAPYAAVSRTESGEECDWDEALEPVAALADRIALLAFAPTKYRIYAPLIDGELDAPLPNPRRDFLAAFAKAQGIAFVDLTPALSQAAIEGPCSDHHVYWHDDTYWAPAGIAAGARSIAEAIGSATAAKP